MSLATGIGDLREAVERYARDGAGAGADLVTGVSALEDAAAEASLVELSELCRGAVQTLEQIAVGDTSHDEAVLAYVLQLIDYAAALDGEELNAAAVPPSTWTPADAGDEQHFLETLEMFVQHALGMAHELERALSVLESSGDDAALIADIRRTIHALEGEFGVLKFAAAQRFCRVMETAIDAVTTAGVTFPCELVLDCVAVLVRYLNRLGEDPSAPLEDVTELLEWLRQAPFEPVETESQSEPMRLDCGGEFADLLGDFLAESRAHLTEAEVSMLTFPDASSQKQRDTAVRAFRAIYGVAGLLDLRPLAELAQLTEVVLATDRSGQAVGLALAAIDLIRNMLDGLEGRPMPTRRQITRLVEELEAVVLSGEPRADSRRQPCHTEAGNRTEAGLHEPIGEPGCESVDEPGCESTGEPVDESGREPVPEPVTEPREQPSEPLDAPGDGPTDAVPSVVASPGTTEPGTTEPGTVEPGTTEPGTIEPGTIEPGTIESGTIEPGTTEPGPTEPATAATSQPAPADSSVDDLVDLVRELTMAQSAVLRDQLMQAPVGEASMRNIAQVTAVTRCLEDAALAMCKAAGGGVLEGVVVRAGSRCYVLPLSCIAGILRPSAEALVDRGARVEMDGVVLSIHRLGQILTPGSDGVDPTEGLLIVVEVDGQRSCLLVDEVLARQPVLDKGLGILAGHVPGASGATVLADGTIALILDVESILAVEAGPTP